MTGKRKLDSSDETSCGETTTSADAGTIDCSKKPKNMFDPETMRDMMKQLHDPPASSFERELSAKRLPYSFYDVPCETLAKNILGKILVRQLDDGTILRGRIVETESYLGYVDKGSCTYEGRVNPSTISLYMPPGTIYVYLTYGMYHCFNISSQGAGSAVLLRAMEPLEGTDRMSQHRQPRSKSKALTSEKPAKDFRNYELCNGPSKLCMAMDLRSEHTKYSVCDWRKLWLEDDGGLRTDMKIVECPRIGIDRAGKEWAQKPLRFYVYGHNCVSKRNKEAELRLGLAG